MDKVTLDQLREMHSKLEIMKLELDSMQNNTAIATDRDRLELYSGRFRKPPSLQMIPHLKEKVFNLVIVEYAKEYNRLYREYDELTICKPNGKVTNYKPANLNEL